MPCPHWKARHIWRPREPSHDPHLARQPAALNSAPANPAHHPPLPEGNTAADCIARARRPIPVLVRVARGMIERLTGRSPEGRRLVVTDGPRVTLPDRPKNAAANSYAPGQKPGCRFPVMALLGLFYLTTGA